MDNADGIRPSTPGDGAAIVDLLREAGLHPSADPGYLRWKYWLERADWTLPRSYVLAGGGRLLAHGALIPGRFIGPDVNIDFAHMIDWAALPGAPVAGATLLKYIARLSDALLAVGGSRQTLRILPHLGFKPHGVVTGYVRSLRPLRILTSGGRISWRLAPRLARGVLWAVRSPSGVPAGWRSRRVAANEVEQLLANLHDVQAGRSRFERSSHALRYFLQCPATSMRLYALEQAGNVRGYFLLADAPSQVRIADCRIDSGSPGDWRALIQSAVYEARDHAAAAELVVWSSEPTFSRALEGCGFHARNTHSLQVMAGRVAIPPGPWHVQMLENDASFRHSGRADLWA